MPDINNQLSPVGAPSFEPTSAPSRAEFLRSTYTHLAGAIGAFMVLSTVFMASGMSSAVLGMLGKNKFVWLGVLGAFMVVGWIAQHMADATENKNTQLMGLGLYVLAEALIFMPMLAMASKMVPGAITGAAVITLALVGGLTWTAFTTKKDFSFLGGILKIGGFVALGVIVASAIFGMQLGIWFSGLMIVFAGAAVLYDTSNIIHHYPTDRPAGAALHLFASVALMFWYVLRFVMQMAMDD